jgi:putative flippase GtrA
MATIYNMALLKQLLKFIIVGSFAALVHMLALYAIVTELTITPLIANIMAFFVAFNISFFGHHYWTFSGMRAPPRFSVGRFFIVSLSMMGLNECLFYIFYQVFQIYYLVAIFLVLIIIPPLTFVLSRQWAFRQYSHLKKNNSDANKSSHLSNKNTPEIL